MVCNFKSLSSRGALVDFSGSHTNASSSWQEETPIQSEWIAHLEPNQIPQDIGQMKKKKKGDLETPPLQPNLNQPNRIIETKVMVEIPTSVWVGIQIRIGLWIIPDFFTFGQLLVDLEVLIWLNLRFLNYNQFINN